MSKIVDTQFGGRATGPASVESVQEAYSFACMHCGHGWEQSYRIVHHTDEDGHTTVSYFADHRRVPSPLTRPTCSNCGGHLVRIMRSGRVSGAWWNGSERAAADRDNLIPPPTAGPLPVHDEAGRHHWHLPNFLHFLHLKRRAEETGDGPDGPERLDR